MGEPPESQADIQVKTYRCPICRKIFLLPKGSPLPGWFPFCSEHCKLVDLGAWLGGHYKIVTPLRPDEQGR